MPITITPATTNEEFKAIMHISATAWSTDLSDSVPDHTLQAIASNKGTVLIAWDDETPVGFCFSFLSFDGDQISDPNMRLKHYSHQAGILPEYKGQHIGEKLKWAQREQVLKQGIGLITWTFDPLQTLNANLNIRKLGAVCNTYKPNYYGKMDDPLNKGLPTDRFFADWWIGSAWVQRHADKTYQSPTGVQLEAEGAGFANEVKTVNGRLSPHTLTLKNWADTLIFTIPKNFSAIHQTDLSLALEWRLHSRTFFETAFAQGYTAVDLLIDPDRCHYLLQKKR